MLWVPGVWRGGCPGRGPKAGLASGGSDNARKAPGPSGRRQAGLAREALSDRGPHVPPRHATPCKRTREGGAARARGRARRGPRVRRRSGEAEGGARGGAGAERSRLRVRGRRPGRLRGVVPTLVYYALLGKLTNE